MLRLPGQAADLLTADGPSARARKRTVVRLEGAAGSGGRAAAPVTVATSARGALLTGTLKGLQPLAFGHPLTGVVATLTPDVAFALRVGRVDLAGGGNEASVSIGDGAVTLAVQFAAGMVRLTGEVGSAGEAPDDWDIEVELDQRRCSRLLSRRQRPAGGRSSDTVAAPSPPDDPRRRSSRSVKGAEPAGDAGIGSDTSTEASGRRPQG